MGGFDAAHGGPHILRHGIRSEPLTQSASVRTTIIKSGTQVLRSSWRSRGALTEYCECFDLFTVMECKLGSVYRIRAAVLRNAFADESTHLM